MWIKRCLHAQKLGAKAIGPPKAVLEIDFLDLIVLEIEVTREDAREPEVFQC